jgi:hypothetical protein
MRIAFDLTTAQGIGDAVCGLYAAAGLAEAGHSVVLSTRHHPWLYGCQAPVGVGDYGSTQLDAAVRYTEQLVYQRTAREGQNRAAWYLENIAKMRGELGGAVPVVPRFNIPLEKPPVPGDYVMINPFSAHTERVWSEGKFRELAARIAAAGITPVAVGSARDARGLQAIFKGVKGTWFFWQQPPTWVRSAMRQSLGFIGNDSGMTHVAASLGVPTVAIVSHLRPEFVFSPGKVRGVVPDMASWACRFCGWQKQAGFRFTSPCLPTCAALQSISVDAVFNAVSETCLSKKSTAIAT